MPERDEEKSNNSGRTSIAWLARIPLAQLRLSVHNEHLAKVVVLVGI
jgi:hypothetical protein